MDVEDFIKKFEQQLDEVEPGTLTPETVFKELDEWDSMTVLTIIAMADEEYSVRLTGEQIKQARTLNDLFESISSKKN